MDGALHRLLLVPPAHLFSSSSLPSPFTSFSVAKVMPLPSNGVLALNGSSRPGETVQSKPKQAMIVRMSEQTLKALSSFPNNPPIQIEFGDKPGLHIGDVFYPMDAQREDIVHDLYLRASTAAKPTAPLKLHANVTGKFFVKKQLDQSDITKRMRESKAQANQAKQENKIVYVDTPPIQSAKSGSAASKKRKAPPTVSMFRNAGANKHAVDSLKQPSSASSSTAATAARRPSPIPPSNGTASTSANSSGPSSTGAKAEVHPARMRLIHCLAISPRSSDEVVKLVGGPGCPPDKRADLLNLLSDVAEPVDLKSSGGQWQLRQRSWLEVRPYEWPKLTEQDRLNMCRQARLALAGLKIPQSDPAWSAIRWRGDKPGNPNSAANGNNSGAGGADSSSPVRRGITSKEAKEKKVKLPKPSTSSSSSTPSATKDRLDPRSTPLPAPGSISASTSTSTSSITPRTTTRPSPLNLSQIKDNANAESDRASLASPLSATSSGQRRAPGSGYRSANRPSTPVVAQSNVGSSSSSSATGAGAGANAGANAEARLKNAGLPPKPAVGMGAQAKSIAGSRPSAGVGAEKEKDGSSSSSRAMAAERERERVEKEERMKERVKERERAEKQREREKEREKEERMKEKERAERMKEKEKEKEREAERARRERQRQQQQRQEEAGRDKEKEEKERERERRRKEGTSLSTKRKKQEDEDDFDDDDRPRKKRTSESSSIAASATSDRKPPIPSSQSQSQASSSSASAKAKAQRDHVASLKAIPSVKRERENSPALLPPKQGQGSSSALVNGKGKTKHGHGHGGSSNGSATSSANRSRQLPIYTSSEDEGEIKPSTSSSPPPPPPSHSHSHSSKPPRPNTKSNGYKHRPPLPKDNEALRARYSETYTEFIPVFADLVKQKRLLERLLQGEEPGEDEVVLSEGELCRLTDRHDVLKGELEAIMSVKKTKVKA